MNFEIFPHVNRVVGVSEASHHEVIGDIETPNWFSTIFGGEHMAYGGGIHVIPCYLSNHPHIISTSTQKFHSCTFQAAEFTWSLPEQEN